MKTVGAEVIVIRDFLHCRNVVTFHPLLSILHRLLYHRQFSLDRNSSPKLAMVAQYLAFG